MKIDRTPCLPGSKNALGACGSFSAFSASVAIMMCALVTACAAPPPAPAAAPAAKATTRAEIAKAALKAMNFELRDDGWHLTLPSPLTFSFDSDAVTVGARDNLIRVGRELKELAIERALVRGHTDNVGAREYNLGLSKRRADAVARVLNDGGYPAERIDTKGLGESLPTGDNASAEGRAQNRRVVIIVQVN